jgi:hypothetical protein
VYFNAPLWLVKLHNHFDPIILGGNLPTGELAALSKSTLKHIKLEHGRTIRREQILKCITEPEKVLSDRRQPRVGRGYLFATRRTVSPYSPQKIKNFVVHLKPCRIFLVFKVLFVTTALNARKLPPQGVVYWERT